MFDVNLTLLHVKTFHLVISFHPMLRDLLTVCGDTNSNVFFWVLDQDLEDSSLTTLCMTPHVAITKDTPTYEVWLQKVQQFREYTCYFLRA